jgi:hypothetical protein
MSNYTDYTDFYDDLVDTHEMRVCLEEEFEVDGATAKESLIEWAKLLIQRLEA